MAGINTKVIIIANSTPNAREIAIGIKNLACIDLSNIIGNKPTKVVTVVMTTGKNLRLAAKIIDLEKGIVCKLLLIKCIKITPSFITIPVKATTPNKLKTLSE